MIAQYRGALVRFVLVILAFVVVGVLFDPISRQLFSEETRGQVLISAVPFVAIFVAILLTFILFIVLVMLRLSGVVSVRAYRPIEAVIIAGILLSIVGLFQPWKLFIYEYAFPALLFFTLAFTLWSHVIPRAARGDAVVAPPPMTIKDKLIGMNTALVVWLVFLILLSTAASPTEPYGMSKSVWNYMDAEARLEASAMAQNEYTTAKIPFFVLLSALPAAIAYFAVREAAASANAGLEAIDVEAREQAEHQMEDLPAEVT